MAQTTTLPSEQGDGPVPPLPAAPSSRGWRLAAAVSVVVCLVVNAVVAWSARTPAFQYDEVLTLLLGRVALGEDTPSPNGGGYYPGWSLLTAPVWLLTSDPFTFYRIAIVLGLLVGLATIWPLARVATRFGVTPAQGVVAAAVVMTLPARAIQAEYALSERLLMLTVACTLLALCRLAERPTYLRALVVGVATASALLTHARMIVLVVAVVVWLLALTVRHWRAGLTALVSTGALYWLVERYSTSLNARLIDTGFTQADSLSDEIDETTLGYLVRTLGGESWLQVVGTFGLVAVGLVAATALAWREVRRWRPGPASFVLLGSLPLLGLSALLWADEFNLFLRPWRRLDTWIYGRYVDPLFALVALVGLCAIIVGLSRAKVLWSVAVALAVIVPALVVVAPSAPTWAFVTPAHIPGAVPWSWALPDERFPPGLLPSFTNENRFWLIASVTALVPLVVLLLVRRRPAVVVALVLALAAGGSIVGDRANSGFRGRNDDVRPATHELRELLEDHPEAEVAFDVKCPRPPQMSSAHRNKVMWWLLPLVVERTWEGGGDVVISCPDGRPSKVPGAVLLPDKLWWDTVVWVLPGDVQDALRAEGRIP